MTWLPVTIKWIFKITFSGLSNHYLVFSTMVKPSQKPVKLTRNIPKKLLSPFFLWIFFFDPYKLLKCWKNFLQELELDHWFGRRVLKMKIHISQTRSFTLWEWQGTGKCNRFVASRLFNFLASRRLWEKEFLMEIFEFISNNRWRKIFIPRARII